MKDREFYRCPKCGKKLLKSYNPDIEIKCQTCGPIVEIKATLQGINLHIIKAVPKSA